TLTEILGDRAKSVRLAAADLLGRIPTSAATRLAETTAAAHIEVARSPGAGGLVSRLLGTAASTEVITLSARGIPADPELARHGLDGSTDRERLSVVLSRVPTSRWPDLVGATAVELMLATTRIDGMAEDLLDAWAAAAQRWRDPDLAVALVAERQTLVDDIETFVRPDVLEPLLAALLRERPGTAVGPLLARLPPQLSAGSATDLAKLVAVWAHQRATAAATEAAALVAARAPLHAAAGLADLLTAHGPPLEDPRWLHRAAGLLRLRAALGDALDSCPGLTQPAPD
ncbi:MAG: DUF5691 domain-containing protein, partial [Beutenbergiaceae bacterium]